MFKLLLHANTLLGNVLHIRGYHIVCKPVNIYLNIFEFIRNY